MNFKQWIKQAYGVDSDDHTARFSVYNMEVAYDAGKNEPPEWFERVCANSKHGTFAKHSDYDVAIVDMEKYDRMVESIQSEIGVLIVISTMPQVILI